MLIKSDERDRGRIGAPGLQSTGLDSIHSSVTSDYEHSQQNGKPAPRFSAIPNGIKMFDPCRVAYKSENYRSHSDTEQNSKTSLIPSGQRGKNICLWAATIREFDLCNEGT
jgi:hypothetical protein